MGRLRLVVSVQPKRRLPRHRNKTSEHASESQNHLSNFLISSNSLKISLIDMSSLKKLNFVLEEHLPGIGQSIVNIGWNLYLLGGMNTLGIALTQIIIFQFTESIPHEGFNFKLTNIQVSDTLKLKIKRKFCAAVAIKNKILAIGGKNSEACKSFEVIDTKNESHTIGEISERTGFVSACSLGHYCYVVSSDLNYIDKISINTLKVRKLQIENISSNIAGICTSNSNLFLALNNLTGLLIKPSGTVLTTISTSTPFSWTQSSLVHNSSFYFTDFFTSDSPKRILIPRLNSQ